MYVQIYTHTVHTFTFTHMHSPHTLHTHTLLHPHAHFSLPPHPHTHFFTAVLGLHCPITHTSPSLPRTTTHTSPSPCTPTVTVLLPPHPHTHSHLSLSLHPHTHSSPPHTLTLTLTFLLPAPPHSQFSLPPHSDTHTSPSPALQHSLFLHSSLWPPSCHGHCPPQLQLIHQVEKGVVLTLRDAHRQLLEKDIGKKAWLICTSQGTRGLVPCETYLTVDRIDDIR